MSETKLNRDAVGLAQDAWLRYLEVLDGFRPDLFRYCRRLTGNVWDAEDLVQDTLEQGFARLGTLMQSVDNPRGYMLRIASNLWITRTRRKRLDAASKQVPNGDGLAPTPMASPEQNSELRDAGATLLEQLAPQERAAVLLKEIFDLSLEESADVLATSVGAVKAALHRGRERLRDTTEASPPRHPVSRAVVDRFVEVYNQRDLPAMLALMLDTGAIEMHGAEQFVGRKAFGRERGWFYFNFYNPFDGKPSANVWETTLFDGEPIVLVLNPRDGELRVASVMRLETDDEHVARVRVYAMCPDTVREVAATLGRPYGGRGMYHLPREILAMMNAMATKSD
jgi:RNA polymerase sigma-70 factor (ECF subfamily)